MEIVLYDCHPHILLLREILGEIVDEGSSDSSDDESYLRSLDPKDWKEQDHYAVLGLKKKRYLASPEEIRKASFEILGNPTKRLAYDCMDPKVIDDSVPTVQEIKSDFFGTLSSFFFRKSRWSKRQPVPYIGNASTSLDDVHKFYDFWEEYETVRDFSYLDENKEQGEDRDTRRAIERTNRAERARRRAEEITTVRELVQIAKENDPRILAALKAARDAKQAKKKARVEAAMKRRQEEEERLRKEQELAAAARAAEEERRKQESERIRKEKDLVRTEAKREKRRLRSFVVDRHQYFLQPGSSSVDSGAQQVRILADMDLLSQRLSHIQLRDLNERLEASGTLEDAYTVFNSEVETIKQDIQATSAPISTKANENPNLNGFDHSNSEWTPEMTQVLIKAVNLLPAGTSKRWEAIAAYVNQHVEGASVTGKKALKYAKTLKQDDAVLRKTANDKAFDSFQHSVRETDAVKNVTITNQIEAEANRPWTLVEQRALEQALKTYPSGTTGDDDRWQRIADVVGTRTRRECILRCKDLFEQIRAKKAAIAAVTKPQSNSNVQNSSAKT